MKNKINQSILEKRITEKAEKRFKNVLNDLGYILSQNLISARLKIKDIELVGSSNKNPIIFTTSPSYTDIRNDCLKENTNFKEIKKELIEQFKKEETDNILSKLENLNYLFNE